MCPHVYSAQLGGLSKQTTHSLLEPLCASPRSPSDLRVAVRGAGFDAFRLGVDWLDLLIDLPPGIGINGGGNIGGGRSKSESTVEDGDAEVDDNKLGIDMTSGRC